MLPKFIVLDTAFINDTIQTFVEDPRYEFFLTRVSLIEMIQYFLSPEFREVSDEELDVDISRWVMSRMTEDDIKHFSSPDHLSDLICEVSETMMDRLYLCILDQIQDYRVERYFDCYRYHMWLDRSSIVLIRYINP